MSLVTVADVKALGRIDYDTHDLQIQLLIDGVEAFVENYCGLKLTSATRVELLDGGGRDLFVNYGPITAVAKVEDREDDDEIEDASNYFFTDTRILKDEDYFEWEEGMDRWRVTYTGGYDASTVPAGLKNAIIGLTLLAYNNMAGSSSKSGAGGSESFANLAEQNNLTYLLDIFSLRRIFE